MHGRARGSPVASKRVMARPLRLHIPNTVYHVMSRGNARQQIFLDARDYQRFLALLSAATLRFHVSCLAYCLMPNHFHLLVQPRALPLSRMMQQLNSGYAAWFNRRHDRVGHLLQGRFKALLVETDVYFLRVLRYIVSNPVVGGRVRQPANWRWSSYRATAGIERAATFLAVRTVWDAFDPEDGGHAQHLFAAFIAGPEPVEEPQGPVFFGSTALAACVAPRLAPLRAETEFARAERFAVRPTLDEVLAETTDAASLDRRMHEAYFGHGYTLREIGGRVGLHTTTVWKRIHRIGHPGTTTPNVGGERFKI